MFRIKTKSDNYITFKTTSYCRNFDMFDDNDDTVCDVEGRMTKLNTSTTTTIGIFDYSIINLNLSRLLKYDIKKMLYSRGFSSGDEYLLESFASLFELIKSNNLDTSLYSKLVLVHMLAIKKEYRGLDMVQQFTEYLYRNHYDVNTGILVHVKPFQYNFIGKDNYLDERNVESNNKSYLLCDYFNLEMFSIEDDYEMSNYKLFSIAKKVGFNRVSNDNNIFMLDSSIISNSILYR